MKNMSNLTNKINNTLQNKISVKFWNNPEKINDQKIRKINNLLLGN